VLLGVVRVLRLASIAICVIVIAAFAVFAVDQTKTASGHQQEQVAASGAIAQPAAHATKASSESPVHKTLDEASEGLTSPFAGVVSESSSEWASHGVKLLLALLVYGFGLGFVARTLRVRA
jgi:hypothetical protein